MEDLFWSPGWRGERTPRAWIIGLGLIGGSWAGALSRLGWQVNALDLNPKSLNWAKEKGWIQGGWTEWPVKSDKMEADLVVLALPVHLLTKGLAETLERVCDGAIITDVGSIKTEVCNLPLERSKVYFVGGHPMAGSEKSGVQAAHPELFTGYPYVIAPAVNCPEPVVQRFANLLQAIGATVVRRSPDEHDGQVALVSHLPHLLSVALALSALEDSPSGTSSLELAGRSFRDLTRIAESSPEMWQEILLRNAPAVLSSLDLWENKLKHLRQLIEEKNGQGIAEAFRKAQGARQRLGG